jgi:hypothetical protein
VPTWTGRRIHDGYVDANDAAFLHWAKQFVVRSGCRHAPARRTAAIAIDPLHAIKGYRRGAAGPVYHRNHAWHAVTAAVARSYVLFAEA